jgi:tRNA pseudouridine13 synthase
MEDRKTQLVISDNGFQPEREAQVGILHFVNLSNPGFSGTLKQRCVLMHIFSPPLYPLSLTG